MCVCVCVCCHPTWGGGGGGLPYLEEGLHGAVGWLAVWGLSASWSLLQSLCVAGCYERSFPMAMSLHRVHVDAHALAGCFGGGYPSTLASSTLLNWGLLCRSCGAHARAVPMWWGYLIGRLVAAGVPPSPGVRGLAACPPNRCKQGVQLSRGSPGCLQAQQRRTPLCECTCWAWGCPCLLQIPDFFGLRRTSGLLVLRLATRGIKAMTAGTMCTITSASWSLPTLDCGPLLSPGATISLA